MTHVASAAPAVPTRLQRTYRVSADGTRWDHLCSACQVWLPADAETFQRTRAVSTGISSLCLRCAAERKAEWQRTHPAESYEQHKRHRSRRAQASGKFTALDREQMLDRFGHSCVACGRHESEVGTLHADHIVPAPEGSNSPSNRQPLCTWCHARKGTQTTDYRPLFLQRMRRAA